MAYGSVKRSSKRAQNTPGKSYEMKGKKPKLGSGKRFEAVKKAVAKSGVKDPGAVAAAIGRKKYGAKKMAKMAAKGRKK